MTYHAQMRYGEDNPEGVCTVGTWLIGDDGHHTIRVACTIRGPHDRHHATAPATGTAKPAEVMWG